MQVPGLTPSWPFAFQSSLQIRSAREPLEFPTVKATGSQPREFARQVYDLAKALKGFRHSASFRMVHLDGAGRRSEAGSVIGSDLGLQLHGTAATLGSSAEVNAIPTSFGPFQPGYTGDSTATATIGGIYDGSLGDDTLTFEVRRDGILGEDDLRFRIYDGNGDEIDEIDFKKEYTPGEAIQTTIGLTVALSAGELMNDDTFELQVFSTVGSSVDPTKAFNGTGNDIPNFEPGLGVNAGSFTINGAVIDVAASDSIQSVLGKINASAAGVSATFDALTERVQLTQEEPGQAGVIDLDSDTTGFFDAVKLSAAVLVSGTDADMYRALDEVPELGVQSGEFTINGVSISVDTQNDSLYDLIDRINAAGVGVIATFDLQAGAVELSSQSSFELADGTSGLFSALGIEEGRHGQEAKGNGFRKLRFKNTGSLRRDLREVSKAVNDLLKSPALSGETLASGLVSNALHDALRTAFEELKPETGGVRLSTGLGVRFDLGGDTADAVRIDQGDLSRALSKRPEDLARFLLGDSSKARSEGFIALLSKAVEQIEQRVYPLLDPDGDGGLIVDRLA